MEVRNKLHTHARPPATRNVTDIAVCTTATTTRTITTIKISYKMLNVSSKSRTFSPQNSHWKKKWLKNVFHWVFTKLQRLTTIAPFNFQLKHINLISIGSYLQSFFSCCQCVWVWVSVIFTKSEVKGKFYIKIASVLERWIFMRNGHDVYIREQHWAIMIQLFTLLLKNKWETYLLS